MAAEGKEQQMQKEPGAGRGTGDLIPAEQKRGLGLRQPHSGSPSMLLGKILRAVAMQSFTPVDGGDDQE